jgi:hypothetical protein
MATIFSGFSGIARSRADAESIFDLVLKSGPAKEVSIPPYALLMFPAL